MSTGKSKPPPQPLDVERFQEWSRILMPDPEQVSASREFLEEHMATVELLAWLHTDEPTWPAEAAHRLLLLEQIDDDIDAAYQYTHTAILNTLIRQRLEVGQGRELLDAAALLVLLDREDPSAYFYAALGAALKRDEGTAVKLAAKCSQIISGYEEPTARKDLVSQGLRTIDEVETLHGLDDLPCMSIIRQLLKLAASG